MKNIVKYRIRQVGDLLDFLIPFIIIGAIIFFGMLSLRNQESNKEQTNDIKRLLCENIPEEECNLSQAVNKIIENQNENQKRDRERDALIACLLIVHGQRQLVDSKVPTECQKMAEKTVFQDMSQSSEDSQSSHPAQPGRSTPRNKSNQSTSNNPPPSKPLRVLGVPVCVPDPLGLVTNGVCVKEQ